MPDDNIDSADMAQMALSQAVEDHIEKSKDTIDRISELEDLIKKWDMEDVRQLKAWIKEIRVLLQKNFQIHIENFINMKKIPSAKVPEQVREFYKVIAADKKGFVLFGPEMDKITPLSKMVAHYKEKVLSKGKE